MVLSLSCTPTLFIYCPYHAWLQVDHMGEHQVPYCAASCASSRGVRGSILLWGPGFAPGIASFVGALFACATSAQMPYLSYKRLLLATTPSHVVIRLYHRAGRSAGCVYSATPYIDFIVASLTTCSLKLSIKPLFYILLPDDGLQLDGLPRAKRAKEITWQTYHNFVSPHDCQDIIIVPCKFITRSGRKALADIV